MANSIRHMIRRKTTADWLAWQNENSDLRLADGEVVYDITENRFKVGDGINRYEALVYVGQQYVDRELIIHDTNTNAHQNLSACNDPKRTEAAWKARTSKPEEWD